MLYALEHIVNCRQRLQFDIGLDLAIGSECQCLGHILAVAGHLPGQIDVLLAEEGVPYDQIFQFDEINEDFKNTDIVLVVGANDVVNPAVRTDETSQIFGVPILNAGKAKQVYVVKRGKDKGCAGIVNALFYGDNCNMVYGHGPSDDGGNDRSGQRLGAVQCDLITATKDHNYVCSSRRYCARLHCQFYRSVKVRVTAITEMMIMVHSVKRVLKFVVSSAVYNNGRTGRAF